MHKIIRLLIQVALAIVALLFTLYSVIYLTVNIPTTKEKLRQFTAHTLSEFFETEIQVGDFHLTPFNDLQLSDLLILDQQGDTLFYAAKAKCDFDLWALRSHTLRFESIELEGLKASLSQETAESPLNLQFFINKLKPKQKRESKFLQEIILSSIIIKQGDLSFNRLWKPEKEIFDANHLHVSDLFLTVSLDQYTPKALKLELQRLSLKERSGLQINNLNFALNANKDSAQIKQLHLELPHSSLSFNSINADYTRVEKINQLVDSAYFFVDKNHSTLTLSDLKAFAPKLKNFQDSVNFNIEAQGSINNFKLNAFSLYVKNKLEFLITGELHQITHPEQASLLGEVKKAQVTPQGTDFLINNFTFSKALDRKWTQALGKIRFEGKIAGLLHQLQAVGNLETQAGNIDIQAGMVNLHEQKKTLLEGHIKGENIRLADFSPKRKVPTNVTLDLNFNLAKAEHLSGSVKGSIHSLEYQNHQYNNLQINTSFEDYLIEGSLALDDEHLEAHILGKINLDSNNPFGEINARFKGINLQQLNLAPKLNQGILSFNIHANFTGKEIDNTQGYVFVDSLSYNSPLGDYKLDQLVLYASNHTTPQYIIVNSEAINGRIEGKYRFRYLVDEVKHILSAPLPNLANQLNLKKPNQSYNDFEYEFQIEPTHQLSKIFKLPFTLQEKAIIKGEVSFPKETFELKVDLPAYQVGKMKLTDGSLYLLKPQEEAQFRFHSLRVNPKGEPLALTLQANTQDSCLHSSINWSNLKASTHSGRISLKTSFGEERYKRQITSRTHIHPSKLFLNDSIWHLQEANVVTDSIKIFVNQIGLTHEDQYLKIDGKLSALKQDSLLLSLNRMDLKHIFDIVNKEFLHFGGEATGQLSVSLHQGLPRIATQNLNVESFTYNEALLGDLKLKSGFDTQSMGIMLDGTISKSENLTPTRVLGGVFLKKDSINLNFDAHNTNVAFARIWTDKVVSNLRGEATGNVTLLGKFKEIVLDGYIHSKGVTFDVDYLNTSYTVSDSLFFNPTGIHFKKMHATDGKKGHALTFGYLKHRYFKDLTYDINVHIPDGMPFQVLNLTEKINPLYWGDIYASGKARIYGNQKETFINVNAKSSKTSNFFFSLNSEATANDYQFIEFQNLDQHEDSLTQVKITPTTSQTTTASQHAINLNLQMEATNLVNMNLIMDPATGDVITGLGNGNIRLEFDPKNDIRLYGNYRIDEGNYYFNLQDVIQRDFKINQGSTISFQGDPMGANLDMQAIYQVTANITDLDESLLQSSELSRPNVPVQCLLNIEGALLHPDLSFDINLPTVSTDIDRRVRSIIGTDEMMNKQIIYLMVLNKFLTPEYNSPSGIGGSLNDLSSVASSTLSSQLNNLLGEISDKWNIGTNIRSDKGDFSDVEVELALSSQLLNNRLLINGNFGYKENQQTNNSFIGDFDLEYLLNPTGSVRLKAYNQYNDRVYSIKSALTTQGVGIIFKKDFNSISSLYNKFLERRRKQKIKPAPKSDE